MVKNLKAIRKDRKLTQQELSYLTGIGHISICNYENNNQSPKYETLEKLAEALDCTVTQLVKGEPPLLNQPKKPQ